jgi:hypothetical protein
VDLIKILRQHLGLSIFLLLLLGGAGGFLVHERDVVKYSTFAEVHVARNFQRMLQADREMELRNMQEYDTFRNEQIALMLRPDVLAEGLRRAGQLDAGVWGEPEFGRDGVLAGFAMALDISFLRNTYRISLELSGPDPEVLKPALDGLLSAFLDAHRAEFSFEQDKRPEILRESLAKQDAAISVKRAKLKSLAEELKVLDFQGGDANPWVTPLENARLALVEAERGASSLRLELAAEDSSANLDAELNMVLLGGAESVSVGLAQIVGPLIERRGEIKSRLLKMNSGHAARLGLEQEVKSLEAQVADLLKRHIEASRVSKENKLQYAEASIEQLAKEVKDLGLSATNFVSAFQEGVVLETALAENLARRAELNSRLNFFEIETKSPSYVRVVQAATEVDPAGESKLIRNSVVVVFLAAILAFGLPLLLTLSDKRVHTTRDIEAVFGFPPAIWIPEPKKGAQMRLAQDQIRRFALALDRDQSQSHSRLIQFTEVKSGRGAENVVGSIAKALAGFGRKVLVVDAAAPRRSRTAASYSTVGFLGLMAGKELEVTPKDGWDFLEYGNPMVEKGQVFRGWDDILRKATEDYDMVLIRADPLLGSPDAEQMASSVDLVVLMVEAETQTHGEIQRAGDVLASLHPAAVGTILHNAKIFRSHGYYRELLKEQKALPPNP